MIAYRCLKYGDIYNEDRGYWLEWKRHSGATRKYWLTRCSSTRDYIQIRTPVYISHSAGRYAVKRFRKAQCPIIERLTNSLMMNGRNNGKKLMAVRIVAHSFEIVSLQFDP